MAVSEISSRARKSVTIGNRSSAARRQRIRDRGLRASQAESRNVTYLIDIDAQQSARFNVAKEVSAQHHSVPNFALNSKVDLHRPWRRIIRREQSRARYSKAL